MLIIPEDMLFNHAATTNNVQYGSDREFPVLIGLPTSADFNRLLIDFKLVIINFRISADSRP